MIKNNKGITLIALAITLIVLFIIIGITLSELEANNGLIEEATKASEEYKKAEDEEIDFMKEIKAEADKE